MSSEIFKCDPHVWKNHFAKLILKENCTSNLFRRNGRLRVDYDCSEFFLYLTLLIALIDIVEPGFGCFYCYVNKLKPNEPNTINLVENGLKNWAQELGFSEGCNNQA